MRGIDECPLHPLLLAGAAAGKAPTQAACIHGCWHESPVARHRRMPLACTVSGRSCRLRGIDACRGTVAGRSFCRRGLSSCRLHAFLLAGAAAGEAPVQAACMH